MLVTSDIVVDTDFPAARASFASLVYSSLVRASEEAYGDGLAGLIKVGPLGARPVVSKLVDVQIVHLAEREDESVLTLRWEAAGPNGVFPALDADITLTAAGQGASRLVLSGSYRPPLAALGAALDKVILHRAATATTRSFLTSIAAHLEPSRP